jgi:hypothetical protein
MLFQVKTEKDEKKRSFTVYGATIKAPQYNRKQRQKR